MTRWLFVLGTAIWLLVACWEAFDLGRMSVSMSEVFHLPDLFTAEAFGPTIPRWMLLCLPAFPTFFTVLVMFRKRWPIK